MDFRNLVLKTIYEEHDPFITYVRYMSEDELIKIGMKLEKHKDHLANVLDFNKGWYVDFGAGAAEYIISFNTSWKGEVHLGYAFEVNPPFYSNIGAIPKGNGKACKAVEQFEFKQDLTRKHGLSKDQAESASSVITKI